MPAASSDKVVAPLEQRPLVFAKDLTTHDRLVLTHLAEDLEEHRKASSSDDESHSSPVERRSPKGEKSKPNMPPTAPQSTPKKPCTTRTKATLDALKAKNDPSDAHFDPTVFVSVDLPDVQLPKFLQRYVLSPYIKWARHAVRNESDVVMITHLILYFTTSVPSALYLFYSFDYWHAFAHVIMQGYYMGTYTLMMHQHIHGRGILSKRFWLFDTVFPYITDPLMGHTWNTYFYHHVKHHHVEGNGPNDLSSTLRYQRDDVWHFLHYIGRFYFLIWFDLPRYFLRKGKTTMAAKAAFFEIGNYLAIYLLAAYVNKRAAVFVFVLPLAFMRIGLMVGNWGQHAFVDDEEPDSDFRSSITLIDVPSNRYCFNDGYHTSHHLNPRRHWRDHPAAFISQKQQYADEQALVFHDIDYIMITIRLLMKDYVHLAQRLVPIGRQMDLTISETAELLKRKTRAFGEEEIRAKFGRV